MSAIGKGHAKLVLLACAALCCLAAAATARADAPPAPDTVSFCVGGHTETYDPASDAGFILGTFVVPVGGYFVDESIEGDSDDDANESFAQQLVDGEAAPMPITEAAVFVTVHAGACDPPAAVPLHNHSPLCYSTSSNDVAYFDSGDLAALVAHGYSVPSVVKVGGTWQFVCNPGADLVPTGTKLGGDRTTIVSDAFAGSNDGWWEILEPKKG